MSNKRIRHHVNPLSENYLDFEVKKPNLNFDTIEVELGCAEGDFLFERSVMHPDFKIIGVEIRKDLVDKINKKGDLLQVNVEAVFANINTHIPVLFPKNTVDRFFINFPDPWFKKGHKKRRIIKPETVKELVQALKPTGEIFFQSDIYDLALNALAVMEEYSTLTNVEGTWSFMRQNPFGAISRRERFVTEEGKRVWRFLFSK